jgi:hypothetical protein
MTGHGDAPSPETGGVNRHTGHGTTWQSQKLWYVLLCAVPFDVDRRSIPDRYERLAAVGDRQWWRRVLSTPLVDVDAADRMAVVDRYTDGCRDADRVIRWMEGRCHACGR